MKNKLIIMLFFAVAFNSCGGQNEREGREKENDPANIAVKGDYTNLGKTFNGKNSMAASFMGEKYSAMHPGDTLEVKFRATVTSVCRNKGCWMKLDLGEGGKVAMVKFKDYGFFMPKDIEGKEVIVNGKAFLGTLSVEEQKHYAKDEGKTEAGQDEITHPSVIPSFLADGVLIPN